MKNVFDASAAPGNLAHAEIQLYDVGYRVIGISRQQGMCPPCERFFAQQGDAIVIPFRR